MCYVVLKPLSENRVVDSTCTRGLYIPSTNHPHESACERFWTNGVNDTPQTHIEGLEGSRGAKNVKKRVFFSHFRISFDCETFRSIWVVSMTYPNFWHKILGRLRPPPTICSALGATESKKPIILLSGLLKPHSFLLDKSIQNLRPAHLTFGIMAYGTC